MTRLLLWVAGCVWLFCHLSAPAFAQEETLRPSDRELLETLATLKQGQQDLQQHVEGIQKGLEELDLTAGTLRKELTEANRQADDRQADLNKRLKEANKDVGKRFDDSNKRVDDLRAEMGKRAELYEQVVPALFGLVIVLLLALFRTIARDRNTRIKPLEEKLFAIEQKQLHDARNLQSNITRLQNLLNALQELAKEDEKLAAVLQSFSLL
ncbi:MAG: hypothetical protein HQL87_14160 [Magnetococcales bacterium]|nr:hypothetical protein [Magnetococcales bacterium]